MKASPNAYNLIANFEGFRSKAYVCPAGYLTIGYGHRDGVKSNDEITKEQGLDFLKKDLERFEFQITRALDAAEIEVSQNQFDALVSFAYNVGTSRLFNSSVWANLEKGDHATAADCMLKYVYAGGRKLKGLENRREAERALFLKA